MGRQAPAADDGASTLFAQELNMTMLQRLLGRSPAQPPACPVPPAPADPEAQAGGCGWFDSSHELQHGLWVREHASPDAVANDLPLASWLELHLAAGPGRPAG